MAKTKVLVVDDSPTVRQQVGSALAQAGFDVVEAVDGLDGAKKIDEVQGIAVVVCDVNMPNMNGIEMIESVKAKGKHPRLPFLMLTTEGVAELKLRAKQAGAKAWIVKPFKADVLVSAVHALVKSAG